MRGIASGLVLLALPLAAQADIIKCVNATGQVAYQDSRCPAGAEETVLKIRGGRVESVGAESRSLTGAQVRAIESETRRLQRLRWRNADVEPGLAMEMKEIAQVALMNSLHDPDSFSVVQWGGFKVNDEGYRIDLSYRAKNGFGALRLYRHRFFYDEGGAIQKYEQLDL